MQTQRGEGGKRGDARRQGGTAEGDRLNRGRCVEGSGGAAGTEPMTELAVTYKRTRTLIPKETDLPYITITYISVVRVLSYSEIICRLQFCTQLIREIHKLILIPKLKLLKEF